MLERKRVMLRSIAPAIIPKKQQEKKTTLQVFFVLSIWPVSPSSIYGTLLLPLMLLTTTAKKKNTIRGVRGSIAGFTDQRTTFTRAQGAILQSRDFNLRVERARKSP